MIELNNINYIISYCKSYGHYLIVKHNKIFFPLFLKQQYIELLKNNSEFKIKFDDLLKKKLQNNELDYNQLNNELIKKSIKNRSPIYAKHEITQKCNFKCEYCYVKNIKDSDLEVNTVKNFIKQIKALGIFSYYITGGEPMLYSNILEVLKYCNDIGMYTILQTNGYLIDQKFIDVIKDFEFLEIHITHHGVNKEKFNNFIGISDGYDQIEHNAKLLKASDINFKFKLNTCILDVNELKETINYFEKNNFNHSYMYQPLPYICSENEESNLKYVNISVHEYLLKNKLIECKNSECRPLEIKYWLSASGDLYPCELVREKIGSLLIDNLEDIWTGNKANAFLTKNGLMDNTKCSNCEHADNCQRCNAYNQLDASMFNYFCIRTDLAEKFNV